MELLAHDLVQDVDKSIHLDESLMINVQANTAIRQKVEANVKQENRGFLGYAGAERQPGCGLVQLCPVIGKQSARSCYWRRAGFIRFNKKARTIHPEGRLSAIRLPVTSTRL